MTTPIDRWLVDTLDLLARFQFSAAGLDAYRRAPVDLCDFGNLWVDRGARIVVPRDVPYGGGEANAWRVPFGRSELTLWDRLPGAPESWVPIPSAQLAVWWRGPGGTLVPAWNLWGVARHVLTFGDERSIRNRDSHGRFPSGASPRLVAGLHRVPVLNDVNAALLDAAISLAAGGLPRFALNGLMLDPPSLALSHDCDQLRGSDWITQGIRCIRTASALARGRPRQAWRHARAVVENATAPLKYFEASLFEMIALEQELGFASTSYFLVGRKGRFGARSGTAHALRVAARIPIECDVGIHYNYGSVRNDARFEWELTRVSEARGRRITAGRAHYLLFDPVIDFASLDHHGISVDESVGWPDTLSYRAGIAGPFRPFSFESQRSHSVIELPLACMDSSLAEPGGLSTCLGMLRHLQSVGGILTVLVHPGAHANREYPEHNDLYPRLLAAARHMSCRCWTPSRLAETAALHTCS